MRSKPREQLLDAARQAEQQSRFASTKSSMPNTLPEIPNHAFRPIDPRYDAYIRHPQGVPEDSFSSDDDLELELSTEGYLTQPPFAPGAAPCTGPTDPNYRIIPQKEVTLTDIQQPKKPIIVFTSSKELKEFLVRFPGLNIPEDALAKLSVEIDHVVEKGGDCRLMPNGGFLMYTPALEEALRQEADVRNGGISTDHIQTSVLCGYLVRLILICTVLVGGLAFLMNIFVPGLFRFGNSQPSISPEERLAESYKTLGLKAGTTVDEVKKQYRTLAFKLHPDRNPNCPDCEARFMAVADAYKAILDILDGGNGVPTQPREDPDREMVVRPLRYR